MGSFGRERELCFQDRRRARMSSMENGVSYFKAEGVKRGSVKGGRVLR